jgi:hypothetical protein
VGKLVANRRDPLAAWSAVAVDAEIAFLALLRASFRLEDLGDSGVDTNLRFLGGFAAVTHQAGLAFPTLRARLSFIAPRTDVFRSALNDFSLGSALLVNSGFVLGVSAGFRAAMR